jgi:hypothetical protein
MKIILYEFNKVHMAFKQKKNKGSQENELKYRKCWSWLKNQWKIFLGISETRPAVRQFRPCLRTFRRRICQSNKTTTPLHSIPLLQCTIHHHHPKYPFQIYNFFLPSSLFNDFIAPHFIKTLFFHLYFHTSK